MKTKLEMAHEYAIALINSDCEMQFDKFIQLCWNYADAMQVEADKREKEEAAQRRKEIREMLNAPNTFVEREGQHFDDFCSDEIQAQRDAELYGTGFLKVTYDSDGVKYERLDPKTISVCSSNIGLDSQVLKEWQPDWSQAPDWANWWVATANQSGKITGGWFYDAKPEFGFGVGPSVYYSMNGNNNAILVDSFGYTGDWRNSLRKRPK